MKREVLDIVQATTDQWKYSTFFQTFSVEDLQEALDYLDAEGRKLTENRRFAIRSEIERRKKMAAEFNVPLEDVLKVEQRTDQSTWDFNHAPQQTNQLAFDWNETCVSIYKRIQFMPPIPIVRR